MDEMSSLDSFQTTEGAEDCATRTSPIPPDDSAANDDNNMDTDNATTTTTTTTTTTKDDGNAKNQDDDDEDFDEISDGTFEVDENSQTASIEPPQDDGNDTGATTTTTTTTAAAATKRTSKTTTPTAAHDEPAAKTKADASKSADFEEVDANVSADATADESDVLGESDMTLPMGKNRRADGDGDGNNDEEEEGEVEGEEENERDEEVSEPTEKLKADSSMEVDNEPVEPLSAEGETVREEDEEVDNQNDDNEIGEDLEEEPKSDTKEKKTETDLSEKDKYAQKDEEEIEKDAEDIDKDSEESQKDASSARSGDVAMDVDDDEGEHEDEPVENVQEPEESDVCLIPDDTETEMTEAEKEQAILARENAEKEHEQAEKDKIKDKEDSFDGLKADSNKQSGTAARDDEEAPAEDASKQAETSGQTGKAAKPTKETNTSSSSSRDASLQAPSMPDSEDGSAKAPLTESQGPTAATEETAEDSTKIIISLIVSVKEKCVQCDEEKTCDFRYINPDTRDPCYLCQTECCDTLMAAEPDKYYVRRTKFLLEELPPTEVPDKTIDAESEDTESVIEHDCMQCKDPRPCKYFFRQDDEVFYLCSDDCFSLLNAIEPDKFQLKRHSIRVRNIGTTLATPKKSTAAPSSASSGESRVVARTVAEAEAARQERAASFTRRCAECFQEVILNDKHLLWETMDFCNEQCLGKFQRALGAACQTCHGEVPHPALGKYCVRFGFDIRQFCCAPCLNEFKKGLKTCSCCQKDISSGSEGFLAPVGDKEQFKDFCSQACMRRYDIMCNPSKMQRNDDCAVCSNCKPVQVSIVLDDQEHTFCSNPCFSAFKFVSNIVADQCGMCTKYFERKGADSFTIHIDRRPVVFCSRICLNVYIIVNRAIVSCQWCKVKKYNFDMIYKHHENQDILMCSLNCLTLYGVSVNAFSRTIAKCDNCNTKATAQYHLTMSDASIRNFCSYHCVMQFQGQFARAPLTLDEANEEQQPVNESPKNSTPFPTGLPKRVKLKGGYGTKTAAPKQGKKNASKSATPALSNKSVLPVISNVASLAGGATGSMSIGSITVRRGRGRGRKIDSPPPALLTSGGRGRMRRTMDFSRSPSPPASVSPPPTSTIVAPSETRIITVPPYPPTVRNVQTSCKPQTISASCQAEPETRTFGTQTDKDYSNKVLIPVPVPIFIPQPMYMYSAPFPVPVPIPLPIPVPIFIPTTRNSAEGILKEIKKIQDKMPADPFEAELLMMAEMVAEEKNADDSDSGDEVKPDPNIVNLQYANSVPQHVEVTNNAYGEDVLQMALKMATGDYDQPTVDLESAMQTNTITNPPPGMVDDTIVHISPHHLQEQHIILETPQRSGRGRKRGSLSSPVSPRNQRSPVKRARLSEIDEVAAAAANQSQVAQTGEKPDANMCLKYTFGVNAWKQWVMTKNSDIEKNSSRRRTFKTELLQMTSDELNYSLCLFVKEVRKPNGTEYAPDTIYYLVLGIQQYLYENGRIDNIFTDPYYERFTDCLDEVARRFSVLYNDSQYIVTRVEEEHLWECKQLGAHSPHVLLSTLMFFNTKHFNLTTVEEHMQLSFSHIMKHWKRSAQNAKNPGTRNVLLRFYPPQAGLESNPRKKKVYEQQENEENPLRCPVRLYEFYLSKCPESVKTRNDVFYLQPERSCVPDSPVWYSTQALSRDALEKMLHRVKMVKEINIALLTS